jgi:hypothetical protein
MKADKRKCKSVTLIYYAPFLAAGQFGYGKQTGYCNQAGADFRILQKDSRRFG